MPPEAVDMDASRYILGVGSPMWDSMAYIPESFVTEHDLQKGSAKMMDIPALSDLKNEALKQCSGPMVNACGGCACNAIKVLACLGFEAGFCGGIGRDTIAKLFCENLVNLGIKDFTADTDAPSGEVLCLVTPDKERTFAYQTGASAILTMEGLMPALRYQKLELVYFDVYALLCSDFSVAEAMQAAKAAGAKVCINLGSAGIVAAKKEVIWELLEGGLVNVLTMNEMEAHTLCAGLPGLDISSEAPEDNDPASIREHAKRACAHCVQFCELVVVTLGAHGIWVSSSRDGAPEFFEVVPLSAEEVIDSTGAGDFFAGGFLAAWLHAMPIHQCCKWGEVAARQVLSCFGTDVGNEGWKKIREQCQ